MNFSFQLDQQSREACAGAVLSGRLVLSVSKPVRGTSLEVYFRGKEYTQVKYTRQVQNGDTTSTETAIAHGKHQIVRIDIPVPTEQSILSNGHLVPGRHEVPFRIRLPCDLPSSTSIQSGGNSAVIEYALRANAKGSGRILKNYQTRFVVQIQGGTTQPREPTPHHLPPKHQQIKQMGFLNRGRIFYGANVDNTALVPGDIPKIKVALINESQATLDFVRVELVQVVQVSAGHHVQWMESNLASKRFHRDLFSGSTKLNNQSTVKQRQHQPVQPKFQQMTNALQCGNNMCSLPPVPVDAHKTYRGGIVSVSQDLRIKLKTAEGFTSIKFTIPVQVVHEATSPRIEPQNRNAPQQSTNDIPVAFARPIYDLPDAPTNTAVTIARVLKASLSSKVGLGMGRDPVGHVVITSLTRDGLFDQEGSLRKGMRILEINQVYCTDPQQACSLLQTANGPVVVVAQ